MVLSAPDAVSGWRAVMGPTDPDQAKDQNPNSLRAMFGRTVLENAVHGSSDKDHALQEIEQVFGEVKISPSGTLEVPKASDDETQEIDKKPSEEAENPPTETAQPSDDKPPAGDKPAEDGAPAEEKPLKEASTEEKPPETNTTEPSKEPAPPTGEAAEAT